MLKLNKSRTLFQFNAATLASLQSQNQTSQAQVQEISEQTQSKSEDKNLEGGNTDQKPENQKNKDNLSENTEQNEKKDQEETKEKENKGESADTNKNQEQSQQTQYLFFEPDEFIITTYMNETGWWYGYKDLGDTSTNQQNMGYFPSNYVQVIEEYDQNSYVNAGEALKEQANLDEAFTWNDYAKYSYLDDTKILVEERTKKLLDFRAPENRNSDGIMGYKKIKVHESRSHAINPAKGGKVVTSQIAVKDQSPVSKAYRQINHYFDYDAWIEERNNNPAPKAKADPAKKKKKPKVLNW